MYQGPLEAIKTDDYYPVEELNLQVNGDPDAQMSQQIKQEDKSSIKDQTSQNAVTQGDHKQSPCKNGHIISIHESAMQVTES
jgi:hypothetical protein